MMRRAVGALVLLHDGAAVGRDRGHGARRDRRRPLLALERRCDEGSELRLLPGVARRLVGLQDGHHLGSEQVQRIADVLVLVAAALLDEYDLIDAGILVALEMLGEFGRRADAAALPDRRQLVLGRLEALPYIGDARLVVAVDVVVAERIAEELEAFGAAPP